MIAPSGLQTSSTGTPRLPRRASRPAEPSTHEKVSAPMNFDFQLTAKTVLALAFAALLGCSEEAEQKKPADPATASTATAPASAPATPPPLRIALAGPVTGTVAQYGDMQQIGAKMAIEQINQNGGVDGAQLQAVVYDDA